jgi:hypothetical protein
MRKSLLSLVVDAYVVRLMCVLFLNKTRNAEHTREEHNTPTTIHTRIRGTAYASATSESSDFLIRRILTPDDDHVG